MHHQAGLERPQGASAFDGHLIERGRSRLRRAQITTLQVNVGKRCDLACHHCHVEAGPKRTEAMDERLADQVLAVLAANPLVETLDLTGGAPELNPHFRKLVRGARRLGRRVIDRCNLTILFREGQQTTAEFLAAQGVDVVASLPCYTKDTVEAQRGRHVFDPSIKALKWLNQLGYARPGTGLRLDLVYNPAGAELPPPQAGLDQDYRRELMELFGIRFDKLITITNMPIKRFAHDLEREGRSEEYLALLVGAFNDATVDALMCRTTLSVAYDGTLYDCDFNQALEMHADGPATLFEVDDLGSLEGRIVRTDRHCFGCTAGAGSSCGGALA